MSKFFEEWSVLAKRVLVPGAHVMIATNPLMADIVYQAILKAGFEKRGEIIRLVTTLRGGDRPKNGEKEFPDVSVLPRSGYEPWGLFRKPCEGKVSDNLRRWKTGGLRRASADLPFSDVLRASPATREERGMAPHPSLKPQRLMRHLVRAALPLGEGVVLDTFAGSGSTLAAAIALGYHCIGLESSTEYAEVARTAIPKLARLRVDLPESNGQLALALGRGG
ncbi:MAG: site-specific DNA-methyltransferase [Dehalococcoidia bacterium]|nr:site-specific DNA-methyltransferase [Dehalococcoidia bacterium]